MSRMYTVQFNGVNVVAQQDLFEINAPANRLLCVHGFELSQTTEVGDAAEEGLSILIKRGATTSGTGGTAPTPVPLESQQGAAGFTAEVNNTTKATGGTIVTLGATAWNVRNTPCPFIFTPEQRFWDGPSERLTIELATTPTDSITMNGTLWVEEIG